MIIPSFWAEARLQDRLQRRQVTLRRFGWSELSQAHAQAHAEERVQAAMAAVRAGAKPTRRELKLAYGGPDGLPIREEVLERHGDVVVTRNAYGARCLNVPDVLFADIDFAEEPGSPLYWASGVLLVAAAMAIAGPSRNLWGIGFALFIALIMTGPLALSLHRLWQRLGPGPLEPAVGEFFAVLGTDTVYGHMCRSQRCFRARVSPKPWRIGIETHLRPRPGHWPVAAERMGLRTAWVTDYEARAAGFASCRFEAEFGTAPIDSHAAEVQRLHDHWCRAGTDLPIA